MKLNKEIIIGGISDTDVLLFTKHLAITLKSGLTVIEGLEILTEQAKGRMKEVSAQILERVKSGKPLFEAIEEQGKYFTPIYSNMVRAGEASGNLEETLARLAIQLAKARALRKKVKSAMIYPMFVFIAVFGLGMSVALFVLPKILPLFKSLSVELPTSTKVLIWIAELFEAHGLSIFIWSIVAIVIFVWLIRREFVKPFTHALILKIPVVKGIIKNINLETITRTMGLLLESGLTIDQSIKITATATDNRVYRKAIMNLLPIVEAGKSLSVAVSTYPELFPAITYKMIGVGERTGNLDETFSYLSGFYEESVDEVTKNLATTLEPVMLIVIGILVGFVAISILGPIYEITGSLR